MIAVADRRSFPVPMFRRPMPMRIGRFGLGQVGSGSSLASLMAAQQPGQQPPFIQGSYPGATWTSFNQTITQSNAKSYGVTDPRGVGVYLPYSAEQVLQLSPVCGGNVTCGAGQNGQAANQAVTSQFLAIQNPLLNPSGAGYMVDAVPSFMGGFNSSPVSNSPVSPLLATSLPIPPNPAPIPPSPPVASPGYAASSVPSGVYLSQPSSGFSLSSIPWWAWAGAAAVGLFLVVKK